MLNRIENFLNCVKKIPGLQMKTPASYNLLPRIARVHGRELNREKLSNLIIKA